MDAQLRLITLDEIDINEANPRKRMDEESLKELAASLASVGMIEPVVVTRRDGRNLLVTGERRVRAAGMAGLKEIPAVVRDLTDKQILETMLIENLQREDLAPLEEADAIRRLTQEYGWQQKGLAERVGRSQGWVSKRLRLLLLPKEAQEALYSGRISIEDALQLSRLVKFPDYLLAALDSHGWNKKAQVESALVDIRRNLVKERQYAELEAAGKRVHRGSFESWFYAGSRETAFKLSRKEEREHIKNKRECLAYAIGWDGAVPVCTDPEHWKKELHRMETEKKEAEDRERKAKEQAKFEGDCTILRSITGGMDEVENVVRRDALRAMGRVSARKVSARVFGWKIGRRLDTERLKQEIEKAKGRELRRLWLVALACEEISHGWRGADVLKIVTKMREEDGLGKELARLADEEPSFIAEIGGRDGGEHNRGGVPGDPQAASEAREREEETQA